MKNKGFGHLKTMLFTIKTSKKVGLGGPWYIYICIVDLGLVVGFEMFFLGGGKVICHFINL